LTVCWFNINEKMRTCRFFNAVFVWPSLSSQKPRCAIFRLWLNDPLFSVECRRCFPRLVATRVGNDSMMKKSFGRLKKPLFFRATLLVVGCGGFPLQAADDGVAPHFYQTWTFCGVCGLVFLLAAAGAWHRAQQWRARILRERDEAIRRLTDQSAKNLRREVAEREAAQCALQQSQELTLCQERLAAGLAHEFNNILAIIQGHASLLLDNPNMDEDAIKSITHITGGVERTATLVKQMLAFSRRQDFPAAENAPEKSPPNTGAPRARGGGETVLVVEDEAPP
jgi:signal transduction histidine kinase